MTTEPAWLTWARGELGVHETPGPRSTGRILQYRSIGRTPLEGDDSDVPWCAIFVNAALESSGVKGTGSGRARVFAVHRDFVKLAGPALGAITVFWRGASPMAGLGHVAFYVGEAADQIEVLGGNQGDRVCTARFPRASAKMGLVGYYWPRSQPLPEVAPVHVESQPSTGPVSAA